MTLAHIVSALIFVVTFAVILSERIHRTIAAVAGAVAMVIAGMGLGFYSQQQALEAIDFNTLGLLMGMMLLVSMLEKTGFFQYLAIFVARWSRGNPWYLLALLSTVTALLSMFLDNVTTVVLIVPVTLLIANLLGISPLPLLMAEALLSNVGGTATLVGDPPNVLIGSAAGFSFNDFLTHLGPVVLLAWLATLLLLRVIFRQELAQTPEDVTAVMRLNPADALHDRPALKKILIALGITILLFFLHGSLHLSAAFVAMIGAAIALLWVRPDVDQVLKDVEWSVLLFFAALFVAVGGLEAAGVLSALGQVLAALAGSNLVVSSLLLLCGAAFLSAVVDNIPFTIAMIPVIHYLDSVGIPTTALWWALALGAGFGGNGTPIGSTAGVLTMQLSEKTHTPITFKIWQRSGLIVTIATCLVASVFLVVFLGWMNTR
jgi:Na+/H+ antiporter NhaD/arsenite permease-like protein